MGALQLRSSGRVLSDGQIRTGSDAELEECASAGTLVRSPVINLIISPQAAVSVSSASMCKLFFNAMVKGGHDVNGCSGGFGYWAYLPGNYLVLGVAITSMFSAEEKLEEALGIVEWLMAQKELALEIGWSRKSDSEDFSSHFQSLGEGIKGCFSSLHHVAQLVGEPVPKAEC